MNNEIANPIAGILWILAAVVISIRYGRAFGQIRAARAADDGSSEARSRVTFIESQMGAAYKWFAAWILAYFILDWLF
jgi:hypothetical protein